MISSILLLSSSSVPSTTRFTDSQLNSNKLPIVFYYIHLRLCIAQTPQATDQPTSHIHLHPSNQQDRTTPHNDPTICQSNSHRIANDTLYLLLKQNGPFPKYIFYKHCFRVKRRVVVRTTRRRRSSTLPSSVGCRLPTARPPPSDDFLGNLQQCTSQNNNTRRGSCKWYSADQMMRMMMPNASDRYASPQLQKKMSVNREPV